MNGRSSPALLLASGSPRRRDLLGRSGLAFAVARPGVPEWDDPAAPAAELVAANAAAKAAAVAARRPDAIVLAADTTVALGDRILGTPPDRAAAAAGLRALAGRVHEVLTALHVLVPDGRGNRGHAIVVRSTVEFLPLDDAAIAAYHGLVDPLDKAGGYAIQEHGERLVARWAGPWTNVVGLPVDETATLLRSAGLDPAASWTDAAERAHACPPALLARRAPLP